MEPGRLLLNPKVKAGGRVLITLTAALLMTTLLAPSPVPAHFHPHGPARTTAPTHHPLLAERIEEKDRIILRTTPDSATADFIEKHRLQEEQNRRDAWKMLQGTILVPRNNPADSPPSPPPPVR